MFRQILQLFKGSDPLREILDMFASMLEDGRWMYERVLDIYSGRALPSETEAELFARDRQINEKERGIRRRLVEYLTIQEQPEVASCLILMSVSKDAERIGDYVKNLYDVAVTTGPGSESQVSELAASAAQLRGRLLPLFESTRRAFMTSDQTLAEHSLKEAMDLSRDAEHHVWAVAAREDLDARAAVTGALAARHVKRIARHLGNIATAVIQPVDWLNYSDEPRPEAAESPPPNEP